MADILATQKSEANSEFTKYIIDHYEDWVNDKADEAPVMSNTLLRTKVFPHLKDDVPTIVLLLDNLRFDQWKTIQPILTEQFRMEEEDTFFSILPTSTQYSRNAIFSGMMPLEIEKRHPQWWKNDIDEGGKNVLS